MLNFYFASLASIAVSFAIVLFLFAQDIIKWYHLPAVLFQSPSSEMCYNYLKSGHGSNSRTGLRDMAEFIASVLLDKRGTIYSSRPQKVMLDCFLKSGVLPMLPYGKNGHSSGKLLTKALKPSTLPIYKPRQSAEASRLAAHILQDSKNWNSHVERFAAAILLSVAYGRRVDTLDAKVVASKRAAVDFAARLTIPGEYWAELFPILLRLPNIIAPWKKHVQKLGEEERLSNESLFNIVEESLQKGTQPDSLTKMMLDLKHEGKLEIDDASLGSVPITLFGAGVDTTSTAILNAVCGLVLHASILRDAQAEIDSTVGINRSPNIDDDLPYIEALIKEVLRWRTITPLDLPHATSEDNPGLRKFHIPKGTTVVTNAWAMNRNPLYFPYPHIFSPGRFLPPSHPLSSPALHGAPFPSKVGLAAFGWGRRICPGMDLALSSIRIAISKLIWAFDFLPVEGEDYDNLDDKVWAFVQRPRRVRCQFNVRSEKHREVLKREMVEAEKILEVFPAFWLM